MPTRFPDGFDDLIGLQRGVIARWQAPVVGMDPSAFKSHLAAGRWRPLHNGVYATFTGDPCREAWLWAAVLRAGQHAVLSHHSAAELDGLAVKPSTLIHVMVPVQQHPAKIPGVRVHRSARLAAARHPSRVPPRTRIEETVLDLVDIAGIPQCRLQHRLPGMRGPPDDPRTAARQHGRASADALAWSVAGRAR